jgi:hypothetical protein
LFAERVVPALDDGLFYHAAGLPAAIIEPDGLRALGVVVRGAGAAAGVELVERVIGVLVDEGAAVGASAALDLDGFFGKVSVDGCFVDRHGSLPLSL